MSSFPLFSVGRALRVLVPSLFAVISATSADWSASAPNLTWSTAANWVATGGEVVPPNAVGAVARFGVDIAANKTVTLGGSTVTLGSLTLGDSNGSNAWTIASGMLAFNNGALAATLAQRSTSAGDTIQANMRLTSNLTVTNSSSRPLTIAGALIGGGQLSLVEGSHVLAGIGLHTGGTALSAGQVTLGAPVSSGNAAMPAFILGSGALTISGGATLQLNNKTLINTIVSPSGTSAIIDTAIPSSAGAGNYDACVKGALSGSGTVTVKNTSVGTRNLSLKVGNGSAVNWSGFTGSFVYAPTSAVFNVIFDGGVGGVLDLSNAHVTVGALNANSAFKTGDNGGTLKFGSLSGDGLVWGGSSRDTSLPNPSVSIQVGAKASSLFAGVIAAEYWFGHPTASVSLTKVGTGTTLTLINESTYAGPTTVSAGTLQIGRGGGSISTPPDSGRINPASAVTVAAGATLALNLAAPAPYRTFSNAVANSGTVTIMGPQYTTVSSVISGTGGVTKNGTGTVEMTGTNTYSGPTIINSGRFVMIGSIASPSVQIASGAELALYLGEATNLSGSTLTISGAGTVNVFTGLTVGTGRTLAPTGALGFSQGGPKFASGGTLNLTGIGSSSISVRALTVTSTSSARFTIVLPASFDPQVRTTLLPIIATSITGFTADSIALMNSSGTALGSSYSVVLGTAPGVGGTANQLYVLNSAVPAMPTAAF